jgi:hypothetical protein
MAKSEYIIKTLDDWLDLIQLGRDKLKATGFKPFKVTLSGLQRTNEQNKLLHAVFADCARLTGLKNANWFKNELKCKIGLKEVHFDLDEQPSLIVRSTTEYSTKEMAAFCEKIVAHMKMVYGVDIVLPDDLTTSEVKDELNK